MVQRLIFFIGKKGKKDDLPSDDWFDSYHVRPAPCLAGTLLDLLTYFAPAV